MKTAEDEGAGSAGETAVSPSARRRLTTLRQYIYSCLSDIYTVLKLPVLFACFSLDIGCVLMPLLFLIPAYGLIAFIAAVASQTPVIFLVAREAWRQTHLETPVDRWETSEEQWNAALKEYEDELRGKD